MVKSPLFDVFLIIAIEFFYNSILLIKASLWVPKITDFDPIVAEAFATYGVYKDLLNKKFRQSPVFAAQSLSEP